MYGERHRVAGDDRSIERFIFCLFQRYSALVAGDDGASGIEDRHTSASDLGCRHGEVEVQRPVDHVAEIEKPGDASGLCVDEDIACGTFMTDGLGTPF